MEEKKLKFFNQIRRSMTFKQFLSVMLATTLVVWLIWFFLLFKIDPTVSGWFGFLFFYVTLFSALVGTLTVAGASVRRVFRPDDLVSRQVLVSFRQAVWLSATVVIALFLLSSNLFRLWIISLVIVVFSLIESAFLNVRRNYPSP